MGLDTSHGCWHGAYSAFHIWRQKIAEVAGLPPLEFMEGFYEGYPPKGGLPIKWECLKPTPLHELLNHSDCEGEIPAESCGPIADSLEQLLPLLPDEEDAGHIGNWRSKTQKFIDGLRIAACLGENVRFH